MEHGHEAVVNMLINASADTNGKGQWGIAALRAATKGGHEAMVETFHKAGAIRRRY